MPDWGAPERALEIAQLTARPTRQIGTSALGLRRGRHADEATQIARCALARPAIPSRQSDKPQIGAAVAATTVRSSRVRARQVSKGCGTTPRRSGARRCSWRPLDEMGEIDLRGVVAHLDSVAIQAAWTRAADAVTVEREYGPTARVLERDPLHS